MDPVRGQGTTLSQGAVKVGRLTSIGEVGGESEEIDVTTLDSDDGYREFISGFKDSGEVALSGYHAKGDTGQDLLYSLYTSGEIVPWTIAYPSGATRAFNAYVKAVHDGAAEVDGAVGFSATLRISGKVTNGTKA